MFDSEIRAAGLRYNVPEVWIRAVIATESNWDPNAFRAEPAINDASRGLMQVLLKTARGLGYTGAADGLFDPATSIDLGSKLLGDLRRRYGDDARRIYSAYNSGRPDLWETSSQVRANVERFVRNLERALKEDPLIVTGGAIGVLLLAALLWYWAKR